MRLHDDLIRLQESVLKIANEIHRVAMAGEITRAQADEWQDDLRRLLPDSLASDFDFNG